MSAPLSAILNDRDVSPPRSTRSTGPASATSSTFGPEPVSATSSRAEGPEPVSAGIRGPQRWPEGRPSSNATSAVAAVRSRSNYNPGGYGRGQRVDSYAAQPPPQLLHPSDSVLAKRRRRSGPSQHPSSSPPPSPPKRQRHQYLPPNNPQHPSRAPPPPPPPRRPPPRPPFPGIFNALLKHPELTLHLSSHLTLTSLLHLYAISPPYHHLVNQRFTAFVLGHANLHAPESVFAFPFRCYRRLCRPDPFHRPNELRLGTGKVRDVPSLRWLRMIEWREVVVEEIILLLQAEGLNMPAATSSTIKKLWFLMDIPDNARRLGLLRNGDIWAGEDLYRATQFFLKLDMRFTKPRTGIGNADLRMLLLRQKSLSTLWKVLKREECRSQLEVLRMAVRTHYIPPRHVNQPILGVPPKKVGALQWEGYGKRRGVVLLPMWELVCKEGIRREAPLQQYYLDMALEGFVDKKAGEEWVNVDRRDEVELQDVIVDSEGEEEKESEWESEEEYFVEESDSEDEEKSDDDESMKFDGNVPGNLFFDSDDEELNEAKAAYDAYIAKERKEYGLD